MRRDTSLRITTGAQNEAMRALASKFGAHLTFRQGESTGTIDLAGRVRPNLKRRRVPAWWRPDARSQISTAPIGGCCFECPVGAAPPERGALKEGRSRIPDRANGPKLLSPKLSSQDFERQDFQPQILGPKLWTSQVPVRLSLPNRLTTRRSTTTERCAPCSPAITRVADRAAARPVFFTSARTSSYGNP